LQILEETLTEITLSGNLFLALLTSGQGCEAAEELMHN